jgi:peptidoglycan/LPS O-acetylase OafA/YrhL
MWTLARIITSGRRFIAEVDGLRFIAIMAVVFYHLGGYTREKAMDGATILPIESWFPKILGIGNYGVQLFFVLSGFLLAMPFAKWRLRLGVRPSLKTYYLRRLTRLEPPYIISMCLLFAGGFVALGVSAGLSRWPNLLASLVYQHNLIYGQLSAINCVAWSLEVEVQFYLLAPFLAVVFSIRNAIARRGLLLTSVLAIPFLRSFCPFFYSPHFSLSLPGFLEFFMVGFFLADLYLVDWREAPKRSLKWDFATFVGWPALFILILSKQLDVFIPITILVAYIGAFRGRASSWILSRKQITLIGGMCYSMYLLHYSTISVVGRVARHFLVGTSFSARLAIEAVIAIPAVLAVTIVFFVLLERPCMNPAWPTEIVRRWRGWVR